MNKQKLQREIEKRVRGKIFPLFHEYRIGTGELESVMKWKPIVLLLGNYSSGKSTLVNELLENDVQLTGQAPTDDSFTILTAPDAGEQEGLVPGATLVNDENLPFGVMKSYGDKLISHFQMKQLDLKILENLAIVDSPGMLDSVTEKGRGYNYDRVVGEFARLADLVVLMFDPHKAGTIKETYTTIRNTLPATSEEDRIVFVMSRVDECENPGDLIRSYGTLCWNLSQMTGRKDIPRIFLTFAPSASRRATVGDAWIDERSELKKKILGAPDLKISHILHMVDRKLFELKLAVEAMQQFTKTGRRLFMKSLKNGFLAGAGAFLFLDWLVFALLDAPGRALLPSLFSDTFGPSKLTLPIAGFLAAMGLSILLFFKWSLPRHAKKSVRNTDDLIRLETDYHSHAWARVKGRVQELLKKVSFRSLYYPHSKNLALVEKFGREELKKYFSKIRKVIPPHEDRDAPEEQIDTISGPA
jgi:GTPase SAR1 family protein